jgi:CxxC motif-containing protein
VVTATVPTRSALFPCAPVRTDKPLARELIPQLLQALYAQAVDLPIRLGEVLIEDYHGVRVLFTRTLPPDEIPPVSETGSKTEGEQEVTLFHKAP